MGVNHLADTDLFVNYKPSYYLLLDYYFWSANVDLVISKKKNTFPEFE